MEQQINVEEVISNAVEIFVPYFAREYLKSQLVKAGLKRLLSDRYRNDVNRFSDMFVNPTISLLSALKEKQFPFSSNGKVVLHLVPPLTKLALGEFFYQVGHTNPGTLVVKFAKYQMGGTSVNTLQRSRVHEEDYDIAFTKEYFEDVRSEAPHGSGDILMRTLIVLSGPNWEVQREGAVECGHIRTCPPERRGRLRSGSHLSVQESCEDESSDWSTEPNSPTENNDFSSLRDDPFRRLNGSDSER